MSASLQMAQSILEPVKEISSKFPNKFLSFLPIEGNHLRLGTLFLLTDSPLEEEKRILVDFFINIHRESNVLYHAGRTGRAKTK